jgi:hypothetical protein
MQQPALQHRRKSLLYAKSGLIAGILVSALVSALLGACGGGGGSDDEPTRPIAIMKATQASDARAAVAATRWAITWGSAMLQNDLRHFDSDTTRTRIHTSAGGAGVRIRLSNIFGTQMMDVDSANVALPDTTRPDDPTAIDTASLHQVTFNNGETFAEVPPGEEMLSDPVAMNVPKLSDLSVTLHFSGLAQYADGHADNVTPLPGFYVVRGQNVATDASFSTLPFETFNGVFSLSEVEVQVPVQTRVVIAMSESTTDGRGASDVEHTWPAVMAALANAGNDTVAVGNASIGGNSLIDTTVAGPGCCGVDLLDRFRRDVLSRNPTDIVILAGDDDLSNHSADDIIARYETLIEEAHARNIKVYGGINTPIGDVVGSNGEPVATGFYTPANEARRQQLNAWIRAAGHFDGVVDFSAAVGNPSVTPLGVARACDDPESAIDMDNQGYTEMGMLAYDVIFSKTAKPAAPCHPSPFPPSS